MDEEVERAVAYVEQQMMRNCRCALVRLYVCQACGKVHRENYGAPDRCACGYERFGELGGC